MHPTYSGPVIDTHLHFDATTVAHADALLDRTGLRTAVSLWDVQWPPQGFAAEQVAWGTHGSRLLRCHVPDLSHIGETDDEARLEDALRAAARAGAVGVKVWKNVGLWLRDTEGKRFGVDDARLEVVWHTAAELGLPVMVHQGDVPAFFAPMDETNHRLDELRAHPEWWYGGGEFPPLQQVHDEFEKVVAAHLRTVIVGVHFGCFMSCAEIDRMLRTYPNYHVDTAATVADMGAEDTWPQVRGLLMNHPDRVLFGSDLVRSSAFDMPEAEGDRWDVTEFFDRHWRFFETADSDLEHPLPFQGDWKIHGLDLPHDVLRQLYHDNAARLFHLPQETP